MDELSRRFSGRSTGGGRGNTGYNTPVLNSAIFLPKMAILGIACLNRLCMVHYKGSRLKGRGRACALETAAYLKLAEARHGRLKGRGRACALETGNTALLAGDTVGAKRPGTRLRA